MKTDIIIFILSILFIGTITGCSGDENSQDSPEHDVTDSAEQDTHSDTVADTDANTDAEQDTDTEDTEDTTDSVNDSQNDGDSTTATCTGDNLQNAVVEALNPKETPTANDVITLNESSATIEAGLGGTTAAADSSWIYFDIDAPAQVVKSDREALEDSSWDLAFKRTSIRLNSADSGPGTQMLTRVEETTWEEATTPEQGSNAEWLTDDFVHDETCEISTGPRGNGVATAFGQWYDYDFTNHEVSAPEGVVYFIYNMTTHQVLKLQIQDYSSTGNSATYNIRWAVASPGVGQ